MLFVAGQGPVGLFRGQWNSGTGVRKRKRRRLKGTVKILSSEGGAA